MLALSKGYGLAMRSLPYRMLRARDIGPEVTMVILNEYLTLWEQIMRVELNHTQQDSITWSWEANGHFSTSLAYAAKF